MIPVPGMRPAPGPDQPPIPVRLVTFNIHHGVGEDERHDLPRLAKLLHSVDADVICLQEVDRHYGERSEDVDQALLLSRALDMQLAWGPAIDEPRPDGTPSQYGNALLSRLPVLVSDVHRLPGGGEPRSALRTMLELDGGTLWVTATHLTTRSAPERAEQVRALADLHTDR
ncbi:MAG: endonuclease/exonuclease/phosphatase family protein, partial [Actinomycetes bacterium]